MTGIQPGTVLGHEFVGTVVEVGKGFAGCGAATP